jgi:hypothetical protein
MIAPDALDGSVDMRPGAILFRDRELGRISVGEFTLLERSNGRFWIERQGGEGMEISAKEAEKMLADHWKEHF